jgi:hypothetical protein
MSEWGQGFTLAQNMDWGFLLSTTLPTMGLPLNSITYRRLLRVLCAVRRPVTTLDCVLLKDSVCCQARGLNQSLSLSLSTSRTTPPCQMLIVHPAFNLIVDILLRDTKGRIRLYKLLSGAVPCVLVGIFISIYRGMSGDPVQPCSVPGRDIIQCRLAL